MLLYTKKFIRSYNIKTKEEIHKKIKTLENSKTYQPFVWWDSWKEGFKINTEKFWTKQFMYMEIIILLLKNSDEIKRSLDIKKSKYS